MSRQLLRDLHDKQQSIVMFHCIKAMIALKEGKSQLSYILRSSALQVVPCPNWGAQMHGQVHPNYYCNITDLLVVDLCLSLPWPSCRAGKLPTKLLLLGNYQHTHTHTHTHKSYMHALMFVFITMALRASWSSVTYFLYLVCNEMNCYCILFQH